MDEQYRAMVLASFAADALALGAHWIYDVDVIRSRFTVIDNLVEPSADTYHVTKHRGDLSHYGDQTLLLLESAARNSKDCVEQFAGQWHRDMVDYDGYLDHASKTTLANRKQGQSISESGSTSAELGGAVRISPLMFLLRDDLQRLRNQVEKQTQITHNSQISLASADFLCQLTWKVLKGETPKNAAQSLISQGTGDTSLDMRLEQAMQFVDSETPMVIKEFGQSCGSTSALPGVIHIVCSYQDNPQQGLIENVMAGGDSAARGLAAGMILGAYRGMEAVSDRWLMDMNCAGHLQKLMNQIDLA